MNNQHTIRNNSIAAFGIAHMALFPLTKTMPPATAAALETLRAAIGEATITGNDEQLIAAADHVFLTFKATVVPRGSLKKAAKKDFDRLFPVHLEAMETALMKMAGELNTAFTELKKYQDCAA